MGLGEREKAVEKPVDKGRRRAAARCAVGPALRNAALGAGARSALSGFGLDPEGSASDRNAATGRAPMAARSLSPRARARWPTDSAGCQSRRKWRPAMERSVVTASSSPGAGRRRAQSSPMPSCNSGVWEWAARRRILWSSANSPKLLGRERPGPVGVEFGGFGWRGMI